MSYISDLEKQNEELKEKLAASQLSNRSLKALVTFFEESSKVEWEDDMQPVMVVRAAFRLTSQDVRVAEDLPEAKELFEKFKAKADKNEKEKPNF